MKLKISTALSAAAVSLVVSNAEALTFTETTDFNNSLSPNGLSVGTLDIGENLIHGSLAGFCTDTGDCNASNFDNQDSPIFIVATGTQLDSIEFSYSNFTGPDGVRASVSGSQNAGGFIWNAVGQQLQYEPTEGSLILAENLGLGTGLYGLSVFGQDSLMSGLYFLDYTLTVNVSQIPLPGALPLFLGALVVLRRRHTAGSAI